MGSPDVSRLGLKGQLLLQEKVEMPVLKKKKTPARPKKETFLRDDDSASSTAPSEGGASPRFSVDPQLGLLNDPGP